MNTVQAKTDIRDLILDHQDVLMTGLVHQGVSRKLQQITRSRNTPINGYYFIAISIPDANAESIKTSARTVARPRKQVEYVVRVEIADEALVQPADQEDDKEAFETMQLDFDLLVDRIVQLFEDQNLFGVLKLKLKRDPEGNEDRRINRHDLSGTWLNNEGQGFAALYCQLNLTLVQECVDDSALYG